MVAWLWLCSPLLWMWPNARSSVEVLLSALLLMGVLLSRFTTRIAVILLWITGMCFLGYFFAVHSLPDEFFWQSILGSNTGEAWEYITSYRSMDAGLLVLWGALALFAARHLWRQPQVLQHPKIRLLAWITLVIWVIWFGVGIAKGYNAYRIFNRVDRVYPLMAVNAWERYETNAKLVALAINVAPPPNPPMVDILVVVLGESASAHRTSLLGYAANATNGPLESFKSDIVAMPLTTNGNNTGMTLPVIVAGRSLTPLPADGITSYLDHAKAAGFENHVFANQQAPGFANIALRMRSDHHRQLQDGQLDGDLTPLLHKALEDHSQSGQPLVITLHTYGSHPRVEKRYPKEAAIWADPYDNSLHYTSQLLANWIAQLNTVRNQRVALLYVSDHGQDFPICGGSYTHGVTRSTYEVPFLLWGNDKLRQQYAPWWQEWKNLAQHAVDAQGIPRFNTLLLTKAAEQLFGYVRDVPITQGLSINGDYPPLEKPSLCTDWYPEVQRLHPAAAK